MHTQSTGNHLYMIDRADEPREEKVDRLGRKNPESSRFCVPPPQKKKKIRNDAAAGPGARKTVRHWEDSIFSNCDRLHTKVGMVKSGPGAPARGKAKSQSSMFVCAQRLSGECVCVCVCVRACVCVCWRGEGRESLAEEEGGRCCGRIQMASLGFYAQIFYKISPSLP